MRRKNKWQKNPSLCVKLAASLRVVFGTDALAVAGHVDIYADSICVASAFVS